MHRATPIVLASALALFVLFQIVVFVAPVYRNVVDPASSAGSFEASVSAFERWNADPRRDVLVLGDSRIYAALDPAAADRAAPQLRFLNAGIPGTTPRCWYYYDRAIDPDARRFRAVVIPVDAYADDTSAIGSLDADDHQADLHYVVFETGPADIPRFASSFDGADLQGKIALELALRGPVLGADVQAFVADPAARFRAIAASPTGAYAPEGRHPFDTSLDGLTVDFGRNVIDEPAGVDAGERVEMERQVLPIPEQSESYARYRERWLGALVEKYRRADVPVIFVRIPTRPVHRAPPAPPSGSLVALAARYGAQLVDQTPYVALERPALFADHDHLDRAGSARFSRLLGQDVATAILRSPAHFVPHDSRAASSTVTVVVARPRVSRLQTLMRVLRIGTPIAFQSIEFGVFFLIVLALFYALPQRFRATLLAAASYYFYARWNASFVLVLAALTLSDYAIARAIERSGDARRRVLLTGGVALNLAFLGTFKYLDFATGSVAAALGLHADPWYVKLIVPVGISFHTFQSISYLVDVERKRTRAIANMIDYATYIAFFPQLLSGPIVRAERFFRELYDWQRPTAERVERGLLEIALGLVKKLAIADQFAPTADAYFASPQAHPGTAVAWGAVFAFAMQIYFDFSGYTDIAIGCARLLGFDFPANFDRPYFAQSVTIFWRRWNMTLSSWLRDYVYVPLGGNRHGALATYRNLGITMLLAGLWHGANWTFVAWGGYHGALLAIERRFGLGGVSSRAVVRVTRAGLTFALVTFGWVLFRAASFSDAFTTLHAMTVPAAGDAVPAASWPLLPLAVACVVGVVQETGLVRRGWAGLPTGARAFAFCTLLLGLELLSATGEAVPFVYFKF